MSQPFDDDDWELLNLRSGPAGEPDPEDAGSMSLWFSGLLEDPLDSPDSSVEEDDNELDESALLSSSEENEELTSDHVEGADER